LSEPPDHSKIRPGGSLVLIRDYRDLRSTVIGLATAGSGRSYPEGTVQ